MGFDHCGFCCDGTDCGVECNCLCGDLSDWAICDIVWAFGDCVFLGGVHCRCGIPSVWFLGGFGRLSFWFLGCAWVLGMLACLWVLSRLVFFGNRTDGGIQWNSLSGDMTNGAVCDCGSAGSDGFHLCGIDGGSGISWLRSGVWIRGV